MIIFVGSHKKAKGCFEFKTLFFLVCFVCVCVVTIENLPSEIERKCVLRLSFTAVLLLITVGIGRGIERKKRKPIANAF
jgi:hypothetical protein